MRRYSVVPFGRKTWIIKLLTRREAGLVVECGQRKADSGDSQSYTAALTCGDYRGHNWDDHGHSLYSHRRGGNYRVKNPQIWCGSWFLGSQGPIL